MIFFIVDFTIDLKPPKMKYIPLLLVAFLAFGCNDSLDRSIFKPLSVEELSTAIKKDSVFEKTYKFIQQIKDTVLKTDLEKAKWSDMTYARIHRFLKYLDDTTYFKPINNKIEEDWKKTYGQVLSKVDSASKYWKKIKEDNSFEQYVKIELAEISKEYYEYIGGIKNINLGFRMTPLKGKIDQIRFNYLIKAKIYENDKKSGYENVYSILDRSNCILTSPVSSSVVKYWEANYDNQKKLEGHSIESFNRDYNIFIEIQEIRKDGVNFSYDDLGIPESIENHWKYENDEYLSDLYVDNIAKDVLHVKYLPLYEFRSNELEKVYKKKDSLSYTFLTLKKD